MNNLAILIDLWQEEYEDVTADKKIILTETPKHSFFYNRMIKIPQYRLSDSIINFIESRLDISTIILASYEIVEEIESEYVWYENSRKLLGKERFYKKNSFFKKNQKNTEKIKTDSRILNWKTNKKQIAMHYLYELKILLEKNAYDAIYFCGESWETCVRQRPLGYEKVSNLIKKMQINTAIRVRQDCVLTETNNFFIPSQNPNWKKIDSKEYELKCGL